MAIIRQTWTLMRKNLRTLILRHYLVVSFMAFLVPLVLSVFFSFARNLFVPPATFGIGDVRPLIPIKDALQHAVDAGRTKLLLVNSGLAGGSIDKVLDDVASTVRNASAGITILRLTNERDIVAECPSTLRGVTSCFNAVVFRASPDEGTGGIWNYTIRTDAAFYNEPVKIQVDRGDNVEQVYLIPTQHMVDKAIAKVSDPNQQDPLANIQEKAFTSLTSEQRVAQTRRFYHNSIINFMGVAFIATILWISYHLTGFIATEREAGMSQLIDAMMPVRNPWMAIFARLAAHHWSFSLIYAPAWIIGSIVIRYGVYSHTSVAIVLVLHILAGLALASMSIMIACFFKKAQLSGITSTLSMLLLGILAQALTRPPTGTVTFLSVLFAPCAYVYAIINMSWFEKYGKPASLTSSSPEASFQLPGIFFWTMLIAQIFVYALIGAAFEYMFHGTSSKGRNVTNNATSMQDDAVQLRDFSKIYQPGIFSRIFAFTSKAKNASQPVVAVDKFSLNARRGQIVCLLGANGSGKSTTLDAIAGLHRLTSGSISIDGTGGLGIAPQKNVLWDNVSVTEHIYTFNRLKAPKNHASKEEINELIKAIDLWPKRKALAKTLSGGQKRKLQLGMMLTGGSAVCCVDEVSSGIDPLSRRKLWDILLAERGKRTMILTTHFLDEADLLADHIAILSKGTLRAQGSSVELKDRFGGGYRVNVHKTATLKSLPSVEGVKKKDAFDQVTYVAPSSALAASVIKKLESDQIPGYRFSGPTIEDVFMQLAEEIKDEEAFPTGQTSTEKTRDPDDTSQNEQPSQALQLIDGKPVGYLRQAAILFCKRITILKRNWQMYAIAFVIPILAAGLTSLFVANSTLPGCASGDQASNYGTEDAFSQILNMRDGTGRLTFLAGPPSKVSTDNLLRLFKPILAGSTNGASAGAGLLSSLKLVDTFDDYTNYITRNPANVTMGFWLGDDNSNATFAWAANLFITSSILSQQILDVLQTNTSISTDWSGFDTPFRPGIGNALNLVIYMGIALAIYPAFFALYPSSERRRFVRALQYSNGVRPLPLWLAYLTFDFLLVLVSSAVVTAVWASLSNVWYNISYIFVVLFLYGLCSIIFSYIVSLFTKSQLGAFAWSAVLQAIFMLGYLITYVCVLTYVDVANIDKTLRATYFIIAIFSPITSAMRALFIAANLFSIACDGNVLSPNPQSLLYYGGPILYLAVQSAIMFLMLLWLDGGSPFSWLHRIFTRGRAPQDPEAVDQDVLDEQERVNGAGASDDGLRVSHLTKSFKKNTAVDNVSFGIRRGEVFALLGPNGAGKSTTISVIRGDLKPSPRHGGDVFIENVSVTKNLALARTHLGVCPQADALDQMTVREHLEFYARVRGVADSRHNVAAVLAAVGLEHFAGRMAHTLSGGNKRKLGLGIALMGNPAVLLLDEPSSGLDAAAKRVMWRTLAGAGAGRSILLTTHSMEEADALAGRAAILARRLLALGTPDELRHRFGDLVHVHLVAASAPRTPDDEMAAIVAWVRERLPSADIDHNTYHGQLRFTVRARDLNVGSGNSADPRPHQEEQDVSESSEQHQIQSEKDGGAPAAAPNASESAVGSLVVLLEENSKQLGISSYSVAPTGLDQVFLSIVSQHNVKEENT
ncbi:ABC transporter [Cordyceps fumosorosea ARSEF 2679]|uniref:ABC transporter n=1 Tax=Cordyceps fumosorosea (strain ARSEF 2679) TaxID=1081104 RepID=A0A168BU19_CORFA|nr:ABC transporter [Cordyceps fumosorosea ARSEF 2679]OAA70550.1 ABC transporter [Cordyceps fumosorosea ARSEF 2679]